MLKTRFRNGRTKRVEGYILPPVKGLEEFQLAIVDHICQKTHEHLGFAPIELSTGVFFSDSAIDLPLAYPTIEEAEDAIDRFLEFRGLEWTRDAIRKKQAKYGVVDEQTA